MKNIQKEKRINKIHTALAIIFMIAMGAIIIFVMASCKPEPIEYEYEVYQVIERQELEDTYKYRFEEGGEWFESKTLFSVGEWVLIVASKESIELIKLYEVNKPTEYKLIENPYKGTDKEATSELRISFDSVGHIKFASNEILEVRAYNNGVLYVKHRIHDISGEIEIDQIKEYYYDNYISYSWGLV